MVINRSAPKATVVPILVYDDVAQAVDWLCGTFGFTERLRAGGLDGSVSHAQLAIKEGAVMLGRPGGEFRPPRPGHGGLPELRSPRTDLQDAHREH